MELVDIGLNLTNKSFRHDLDDVVARARDVGVTRMVLTGTSVGGSRDAAALAQKLGDGFSSTAGVHPHDAGKTPPDTVEQLRELSERDSVVAVGECGLDYNRDFSPRPDQRDWFEKQIELAVQTQLPLFLHERDAHEDFVAILGAKRDQLSRAVIHCFTGSESELRAYLDMDLHVGITGWICDERRGFHLRELLSLIPPDRLMIETDAPYLIPRTMPNPTKNRRNEPGFLPFVLEAVAASVGKPPEQVAEETSATARAFFRI